MDAKDTFVLTGEDYEKLGLNIEWIRKVLNEYEVKPGDDATMIAYKHGRVLGEFWNIYLDIAERGIYGRIKTLENVQNGNP